MRCQFVVTIQEKTAGNMQSKGWDILKPRNYSILKSKVENHPQPTWLCFQSEHLLWICSFKEANQIFKYFPFQSRKYEDLAFFESNQIIYRRSRFRITTVLLSRRNFLYSKFCYRNARRWCKIHCTCLELLPSEVFTFPIIQVTVKDSFFFNLLQIYNLLLREQWVNELKVCDMNGEIIRQWHSVWTLSRVI